MQGALLDVTATTAPVSEHLIAYWWTHKQPKQCSTYRNSLSELAGGIARHDSNHSSVSGPSAHLPRASRSRHCSCHSTHARHPGVHQQDTQVYLGWQHQDILQTCTQPQVRLTNLKSASLSHVSGCGQSSSSLAQHCWVQGCQSG